MFHLLAIAFVLLLFGYHPTTAVLHPDVLGVTHVILIAGQSNAVGSNAEGPTAEDVSSPNLLQLNCCDSSGHELPLENCTLTEAQDPLLHDCGYVRAQHIGFGMSFARALNATIPPGDRILLVPTAIGGTGFIDHTWTEAGYGFIRAVNRTNRAIVLATNPVFAGVLWHQGEEDAGDNPDRVSVLSKVYLNEDIIPLMNRLRNKSFVSATYATLPVVVGQLLPQWLFNASWPQRAAGVGSALSLFNQSYPYAGFADSTGLEGCTAPGHGSGVDDSVIHFDAPSQRIFGRRFFQSWQWVNANNTLDRPSHSLPLIAAED